MGSARVGRKTGIGPAGRGNFETGEGSARGCSYRFLTAGDEVGERAGAEGESRGSAASAGHDTSGGLVRAEAGQVVGAEYGAHVAVEHVIDEGALGIDDEGASAGVGVGQDGLARKADLPTPVWPNTCRCRRAEATVTPAGRGWPVSASPSTRTSGSYAGTSGRARWGGLRRGRCRGRLVGGRVGDRGELVDGQEIPGVHAAAGQAAGEIEAA